VYNIVVVWDNTIVYYISRFSIVQYTTFKLVIIIDIKFYCNKSSSFTIFQVLEKNTQLYFDT